MKTGRNSPCPCGSGKKFKKCCLNSSPTTGRLNQIKSMWGKLFEQGLVDRKPTDEKIEAITQMFLDKGIMDENGDLVGVPSFENPEDQKHFEESAQKWGEALLLGSG